MITLYLNSGVANRNSDHNDLEPWTTLEFSDNLTKMNLGNAWEAFSTMKLRKFITKSIRDELELICSSNHGCNENDKVELTWEIEDDEDSEFYEKFYTNYPGIELMNYAVAEDALNWKNEIDKTDIDNFAESINLILLEYILFKRHRKEEEDNNDN